MINSVWQVVPEAVLPLGIQYSVWGAYHDGAPSNMNSVPEPEDSDLDLGSGVVQVDQPPTLTDLIAFPNLDLPSCDLRLQDFVNVWIYPFVIPEDFDRKVFCQQFFRTRALTMLQTMDTVDFHLHQVYLVVKNILFATRDPRDPSNFFPNHKQELEEVERIRKSEDEAEFATMQDADALCSGAVDASTRQFIDVHKFALMVHDTNRMLRDMDLKLKIRDREIKVMSRQIKNLWRVFIDGDEVETILSQDARTKKKYYLEAEITEYKRFLFQINRGLLVFQKLSEGIKKRYPELLQAFVEKNVDCYSHLSQEELLAYPSITIAALEKTVTVCKKIPKQLFIDYPDIASVAASKGLYALHYIPTQVLNMCPSIVDINNLKQDLLDDPRVFKRIPIEFLLKNPSLGMDAVNNDPESLLFLPRCLIEQEPSIAIRAVELKPGILSSFRDSFNIEIPELDVFEQYRKMEIPELDVNELYREMELRLRSANCIPILSNIAGFASVLLGICQGIHAVSLLVFEGLKRIIDQGSTQLSFKRVEALGSHALTNIGGGLFNLFLPLISNIYHDYNQPEAAV